MSVFDKAKKKTEDAAKKASEGAKSAGHKAEDDQRRSPRKFLDNYLFKSKRWACA